MFFSVHSFCFIMGDGFRSGLASAGDGKGVPRHLANDPNKPLNTLDSGMLERRWGIRLAAAATQRDNHNQDDWWHYLHFFTPNYLFNVSRYPADLAGKVVYLQYQARVTAPRLPLRSNVRTHRRL
jgi:hypothetical protein